MKRWPLFTTVTVIAALLVGCAVLEEKEGELIFQPNARTWGGYGTAEGMEDTWIEFDSKRTGKHVKLHALWLAADAKPRVVAGPAVAVDSAPVLLYLHGSRWNVTSSAFRARHMQELGFSVLALD